MRLVDGEHEHRRRERVEQNAHVRQAVKHDEQLHQQRRAAHDPDVKPGNLRKDFDMRKLNQCDGGRNDHRNGKRNDGQRDRHRQAGQQNFRKRIE